MQQASQHYEYSERREFVWRCACRMTRFSELPEDGLISVRESTLSFKTLRIHEQIIQKTIQIFQSWSHDCGFPYSSHHYPHSLAQAALATDLLLSMLQLPMQGQQHHFNPKPSLPMTAVQSLCSSFFLLPY
jgi:hypothetical protein